MIRRNTRPTRAILAAFLTASLSAGLPLSSVHAAVTDTDLFRTNVPPNILLVVDNSKSMNNSVTHPDYDANKGQTQCRFFRDQDGSKFRIWNSGKVDQIVDVDGNNVRGSVSDTGFGKIYDSFDSSQVATKSPTASSDAGAELYYALSTTDQGKGLAYNYATGTRIDDPLNPGVQMYWNNGTKAYLPTRITPRDVALSANIDLETLEIRGGTAICNTTVPSSPAWSIWSGDSSITIPNGSTLTLAFQYLDFLFSDVGKTKAQDAVFAPAFGNDGQRNYSPCLELTGSDNEYDVYRRTRLIALQKILSTVVCEVNEVGKARFGVAQFRFRGGGGIGTGLDGNVQGGYAVLPIADFKVWNESEGKFENNVYELNGVTKSHAKHLEQAISRVGPDSTTPLAETLFQSYTYFMSRKAADLPFGRQADGTEITTKFPMYSFDTSYPDESDPKDLDIVGGHYLAVTGDGDAHADSPPTPVQFACQKNFILFITDGGSFMDVFNMDPTAQPMTIPTDTGRGFDDFLDLIGDHYLDADGNADETEWTGTGAKGVKYMDDIAYFMNRWDFMPNETDFPGKQTIDVYTVGYAVEGGSNNNLEKTANNGNGLYFESADSDQLAADLVDAIADMIEKAQSFTSATVPASRTADGNSFYSSYFRPHKDTVFWEGHLRSFEFTSAGDILTDSGTCAIGTNTAATPPCDTNGELRTSANPFWDAMDEVPAPADRKLYYENGTTDIFALPPVWDTVTASLLKLKPSDLLRKPYDEAIDSSFATVIQTLEDADEIDEIDDYDTEAAASIADLKVRLVKNLRGCEYGTDCTTRVDTTGVPALLGDIYHSNPVVVGSPNSSVNEPSYRKFAKDWRKRDRMIYAGSNDGWLHAFHAGDWKTLDGGGSPLPIPHHDRGTGIETFGYMPWPVREDIKNLRATSAFPRNYWGVDGSPIVADVWMYRNASSGVVDPTLPTIDLPKVEAQWRTIMLGGLRDGGRGYYALDITNPTDTNSSSGISSAIKYPGMLWSFPCDPLNCGESSGVLNRPTGEIRDWVGKTWSEPVITRVRVKGDGDGKTYERWVAIFGGGYHKNSDPNHLAYQSTTVDSARRGRAIFMVDITTGQVLATKLWTPTVTESDSAQFGFPEMRYAIASSPSVFDLDFDGFADVVYIPDVGGNVWKWVIHAPGDDPINNTTDHKNPGQPSWPFRIVFRAAASTEPAAGVAPDFSLTGNHFKSFFFPPTGVLRSGKLVLALGSGERANPEAWAPDATNDLADPDNNRFYVFKDSDPLERGASPPDPVTGHLLESQLATNAQVDSLTCSDINTNYKGYYISARDSEKFVTNSVIFLGSILTGSFMPADPNGANPCEAGGASWLYRFDVDCVVGDYQANSGSDNDKRRKSIGIGMPTRPRVSVSGLAQGGDEDGGGADPCANRVVVVTSSGAVDNDCQGSPPASGTAVRSWRER